MSPSPDVPKAIAGTLTPVLPISRSSLVSGILPSPAFA